MLGFGCYDEVRSSHKSWVENYLADKRPPRQEEWTRSIAVGSKPFVERVKALLGFRAKGRQVAEAALHSCGSP